MDFAAAGDWVSTATGFDPTTISPPPGDHGGLAVNRSNASGGFGQSADFAVMPRKGPGPVPIAATAAAMRALRVGVGDTTVVPFSGAEVTLRVVAEVVAVPGTSRVPAAMIADLRSLNLALGRARNTEPAIAENWVATAPGASASVAAQTQVMPGIRVMDRTTQAATAGREPYGVGGRSALFAAGVGALLLALIGIGVDVRATARRRVGEFAVLQTMGAGSRLLARAVLAEQTFLAGLGVLVGLVVGVGVAATMAPLVILTPTADRPEPVPLLSVPWLPVSATAAALFSAAMLLSGLVAATLGRRLAVARLRIGDEL